ncbi:hypothetical protein EJB05_10169, partial [Eragrostis curvula]
MVQCELLHGNGKKPAGAFRRRYCSTMAVTLLLFLLTNTVSILVSSGAGPSLLRRYKPSTIRLWDDSAALLADLNATQAALAAGRAELAGLYARIGTANELLRTLLDAPKQQQQVSAAADVDGWPREPAGELKLAVAPHRLMGTAGDGEASFPAVGHACRRVQDDLEWRYMNYTPGGECPSDEQALEHRLMLAGCDPLPRRRCRPRWPKGYALPDTAAVWDAYSPCKNFSRSRRWSATAASTCGGSGAGGRATTARSHTPSTPCSGRAPTARCLDIAAGVGGSSSASSGTFAARMTERGVTVVTAAADAGGPFGSFIAARGLVPVRAAHGQLPFFDGTLDIAHQLGGVLTPDDDAGVALEFAMFDVYRVLRPGGVFWLDHFVCPGARLNATFAPMIGRVGFKKLCWNTGRKPGRRTGNDEWYISALLEKPMT